MEENSDFNRFYWWALAYMLCCIVGVTVVILSASADVYSLAVRNTRAHTHTHTHVCAAANGPLPSSWASLAWLLPTTPSPSRRSSSPQTAANKLLLQASSFSPWLRYVSRGEPRCGHVLTEKTQLVWMAYFGSSTQAGHRGYIDSFALNKEQRMSMRGSRTMSADNYRPQTTASGQPQQQMYTSAQLNGLEASSPVAGYPGGPAGGMRNNSQPQFGGQAQHSPARSPSGMHQEPQGPPADLGAPTEYPYRAKAIYSYEANPDDANEISFTKHEILEVSDVSGRWWQAKKENGDTGIAPSNYLILL
jgi:SHO1 osmosensor